MSEQPQQIKSIPKDEAPIAPTPQGSKYINRPTYSPSNAADFMPTFNDWIANRKDVVILAAPLGLKPSTLYLKVSDALKWLTENPISEGSVMKYAALRQAIVIKRRTDGIEAIWKQTLAHTLTQASMVKNEETTLTWKQELIKWFEDAQPMDIFERRNILVSDDQRREITIMLSRFDGVELDVGPTYIRVMR